MNRLCVVMSIYSKDTLAKFKESIESILTQNYKDFDIWIQYDGFIDCKIASYIESLNDDRIHINKREVNMGLAHSLNDLLNIVLSKEYIYIARMDADDISLPDRFEKQILYMEKNLECDCLGTWAIEIDSCGKEFFKKQMPKSHDECLNLFRKRDCMIHPTVMFRKTFFEKSGLYPTDTYFGEDTMMWAKGFKAGCKFANLEEYLFKFRLDENFFKRRRGIKHAISIYSLRKRVNKMLGFGIKENIYAFLYALAKLMPTPILNIVYKTLR